VIIIALLEFAFYYCAFFMVFFVVFKKKVVNLYLMLSKGIVVKKKHYVRGLQHQEMREFANRESFVCL
jgi:hypothetical protein